MSLIPRGAFAQEGNSDSPPLFSAETNLVLVDVQVLHKQTRTPPPALHEEDFVIREDGVAQPVTFFSHDELPLSIVLLFDITDTVRPVLKRLAETAEQALARLRPEDEVSVMVAHSISEVVSGFTTDRAATLEGIKTASRMVSREAVFFNEDLYGAAVQASRAQNVTGRRVVIWLTDGLPNNPSDFMVRHFGKSVPGGRLHTETEALKALNEAGVAVMPLLLKSASSYPAYAFSMLMSGFARKDNPPGNPDKYAELTGGWKFPVREKKDIDVRLGQLFDELRSRYTLGFQPTVDKPSGTYAKLAVELSDGARLQKKAWTVHARDGYYRK